MNYLHKLYFFDPAKTGTKREILLPSSAIDFFTWHKQESTTAEGTRLQTMIQSGFLKETEKAAVFKPVLISHVVEGSPENVNKIVFDSLFFKCTVQYLASNGGMKKYTAWINPENIACIYSFQPDSTEFHFFSGNSLIIANKQNDVMKALIEHNKSYRERKRQAYANTNAKTS